MELSNWALCSDTAFNNYKKLYDYYFGIILLTYQQYLASPEDKLCFYHYISIFITMLWSEEVLI